MSDVISQLSVQLALDSGNFQRAITNANKAVKNLDKEFKSATKGIESVEKSFLGLGTKIDTLNKKIEVNSQKLNAQKQAYSKLEDTLEKQKTKLNEIETTLGKNSDAWTKQSDLVTKNSAKLASLGADISKTESDISQLTSELKQSESAFEQLGNKTQTLDNKLDKIGQSANLAESEFNKLASELSQTGTYFQKLDNEVNQLSSKIDSGKAKINAYTQEISKIGSSLDKATSDHKQLGQAINQTEQELKQAKSSYGENSSEVLQLRQKLLQLKDSYSTLESEIDQNRSALNGYQTELNNTVADVNRLSQELKTLPFDRVGQDMKSMGQGVKGVGQDLMPLTTGITATGIAAGKMAYDFDQGLSKVGTLVQKSGKEMKQYEDVIKGLSKSTGVSLGDMTEAMYQGMSAGADLNNIFGLLESSAQLSVGGFTSNEVAIDGLTTAMNAFGISYDDVNNVADKFIFTQAKGKTVVDELASSMGKVAPIANAAGVSMEEMLSATAALTMSGLGTSEAMTALKAAFSNIIKPSSEAQKMAKDLGLEFNSTALESQGLAGFLDTVKEATGGNIDTMAKLFGSTEALNAILLLTGEGAETFTDTLAGMDSTTGLANESFENMKESAGSKLVDAFNNLKIAVAEMGDVLAPVIETLANCIENVANWFSELDKGTQENIVTFGLLAAAVAPVLIFLGNLLIVAGNVVTIFGGLSGAMGGLSAVAGALSGVALPAIGLALIALSAAIGDNSNMLLMLQEKFGSFGTVVGGICEFISGVWTATFEQLFNVAKLGMDLIAAVIDGPGGATVKDAWDRYNNETIRLQEEAADKLTLTTTRGLSQMRNATDTELNGCVSSMETVLSQVPAIAEGAYLGAANNIAQQLQGMDSTQINILQSMNDTTRMMFQGIKEGMDVKEATSQVASNLELMSSVGKLNVDTLEKDVSAALSTMKSNMDSNSKEGAKAVDTNTKDAKDKASKNIAELTKEVDKNTKDAKTKADSNTKDLNKAVDTNTKNASKSATNNMKDASKGVSSATDSMAKDAKKNSSKVATDMDSDFKKANKSIQQESTNMYNGAKQSFTKLAEIARQSGTDMYNGIRISAEKMSSSAKSSASDMYRGVTTSTSKMASQAISDWNRVRAAYSSPIRGTISVTKTQTNRTVNESVAAAMNQARALSEATTFNVPFAFKSSSNMILDEDTKKKLEDQLRTTKSVEEKITEILRKEVDNRKKLIDSELKKRIDSLNKEKDAYNKQRQEIDYKRSYEDQLDAITKLQKKIDIASKDGSLSGQKRLKELMEQLNEEQRKLEDLVQDKIDSDVNSAFDDEMDRLTDAANQAKDEVDKVLDPDALRDFINQTLETGMFEHLDGEITSLKDTMIDFVDTYGDGLSSIGALIKSELVDNLKIAMETMKGMGSILDKLNIGQYGASSRGIDLSGIDYNSARYRNNSNIANAISGIRSGGRGSEQTVTINFNQPLVVVEGNVDHDLMPEIKKMIDKAQKQLVRDMLLKVGGR